MEPLGLCLGDALLVQLYLVDMIHFVAANAAYTRHFGGTSPPARACVQAALPAGMAASVDVLLPPPGAAGCAPRPFLFQHPCFRSPMSQSVLDTLESKIVNATAGMLFCYLPPQS